MRVGVPREVKEGERRVGMVPDGVARLVAAGHEVIVECGAGERVSFHDAAYIAAGGRLAPDPAEVFRCALIVKVKELQAVEWRLLQPATTLFGFAQLGRDRALLDAVLAARVNYLAYETVADAQGTLPLLSPMSRIAGRLAPLIAATLLMNDRGGSGVLLPGLDGIGPARVVILGAGNVGAEAAHVAVALGCAVTVVARTARRLARVSERYGERIRTVVYDPESLAAALAEADVVIGGVLEPGTLSPKLVTRPMLRSMRRGSVLIDVGIDQGGIAETSRITKLSEPTYVEEGITHYCVPNMPALVARSATLALTQATLPYVCAIADRGLIAAMAADSGLRAGLQVWNGGVTHVGLAADSGMPLAPIPK